jgi:hypothetical protein
MILELKDDEILDFLMTSEFEGDYSPDELKYLLIKWRYFYRVLHGRYERDVVEYQGQVRNLSAEIESLKKQNFDGLVKITQLGETIDSMKTRRLTLKERLSGKIILNEK